MSKSEKQTGTRPLQTTKESASTDREARLAASLKSNIARRKAQAKARQTSTAGATDFSKSTSS